MFTKIVLNETDTNEHPYCGKNISKKVYIKKSNMSNEHAFSLLFST